MIDIFSDEFDSPRRGHTVSLLISYTIVRYSREGRAAVS